MLIFLLIFVSYIVCIQSKEQYSCRMNKCKVELHIHLESAISYKHVLKLIQKYEPDTKQYTADELRSYLKVKSLKEFLVKFDWIKNLLRDRQDYYDLALDLLRRLSEKGVIYVELSYERITNESLNLSTYDITKSLIEAMNKAKELYNINSNLLLLFHRGYNECKYINILRKVKEFMLYPSSRLTGISIAGIEDKGSSLKYANLAGYARYLGLNITVHTGEDGGPEEIWGNIKNIKPDRLGHALNSYKDKDLLTYLKETNYPIEVCVSSNILSGAIDPPMSNHPIRFFYDMGLNVFFNSDDPLFFDDYIDVEMDSLIDTFNFKNEEIEKMFGNALNASFITREERDDIRNLCNLKCGE